MVITELGACEWFVWDLRRSNLIDRGQLDQIVSEFLQKKPRAEPPHLAEYLVQQGILTPFQAERLLQGKTQGFVLGPFTLMDSLGSGSMGTVYKAQNKTDNNWFAVKVLPRRSMWNVRIARRKVRAFEQIRHPSVVPFVDVGTAGAMHYLAWPLVQGTTLDKIIARDGHLVSHLAAHIALQVAEGLEVCHQTGLIHGLIKPSNIMVSDDFQVFILDFGIGCLLAETEGESLVDTMSTANSVTSGLDCASPESIMDPTNLTPPGDQYSLGCILYYMLSGQFPFPDGNAAEKMMAHQFKQPTPLQDLNPNIPKALIDVVNQLMQKQPSSRYGSTSEVVEALRPYASKGSGAIPRPQIPKRDSLQGVKKPSGLQALPSNRASGPLQSAPLKKSGARLPTLGSAGSGNNPKSVASPLPNPSGMSNPGLSKNGLGSPAAPQKGNVPVSTPTPQPRSIGALPTRNSLKGTPPAPPHQNQEDEMKEGSLSKTQVVPPVSTAPSLPFMQKYGPIFMGLGAGIAVIVVFMVIQKLM